MSTSDVVRSSSSGDAPLTLTERPARSGASHRRLRLGARGRARYTAPLRANDGTGQ